MKLLAVSVVCSLIAFLAGCRKAPETMQKAHIEDYVLEYEIQGSGEPILFIHGSVFAETFVALMPEPALSNYKLIRYHVVVLLGAVRLSLHSLCRIRQRMQQLYWII